MCCKTLQHIHAVLFPFIKIEAIFALSQCLGNAPVFNNCLNSVNTGVAWFDVCFAVNKGRKIT